MALPTKKSEPKKKLEDYTVFLYGEPKIGKTTFCSQFDEPLFILTEAGTNALSVYESRVTTWMEFKLLLKEIAEASNGKKLLQKTVIIDTFDNLCGLCTDHICKDNGVPHLGDLPFGKGFGLAKAEMARALNFLSLLPTGLVLTSHVKNEEVKTRIETFNKATPSVANTYLKLALGMSDLILFAHNEQIVNPETKVVEEKRLLETKGSQYWIAGDRTGLLPSPISFDYASFSKIWINSMKGDKKI